MSLVLNWLVPRYLSHFFFALLPLNQLCSFLLLLKAHRHRLGEKKTFSHASSSSFRAVPFTWNLKSCARIPSAHIHAVKSSSQIHPQLSNRPTTTALQTQAKMPFPAVHLSLPSSALFQFPPSNEPQVLPPPQAGSTLSAPPFSIPSWLYVGALDAKVPITIALVYAVTVALLNAYNRSGGNKPWRISKTKAFFWFVVAHNVLLAVYSAWTFVGMLSALRASLQRWSGPTGLAGTVDSLCKVHGVSGLGRAVAYNGTESRWISQSPSIFLTDAGVPDSTDVGRLWNEGLAFYGWFFYLSKFYEVLDTAIILAKGKRSSTLQTYHHAGAMMCMWAGIRYMSPPIWMFVFVNSGIHALMVQNTPPSTPLSAC